MIYFNSDYLEGAHPALLEKLNETNMVQTVGYGEDEYCAAARERIRAACGCPEAFCFDPEAAGRELDEELGEEIVRIRGAAES